MNRHHWSINSHVVSSSKFFKEISSANQEANVATSMLFLVITFVISSNAVPLSDFYPYGSEAEDEYFVRGDDLASKPLNHTLMVFGSVHNVVRVCTYLRYCVGMSVDTQVVLHWHFMPGKNFTYISNNVEIVRWGQGC